MNHDQSQQLERIVAYLDGELSPEEGAQVEQQLAADQQFRQQLQGAERAWAALDQLPIASVGDEFARTTMELVVEAARQDVAAKTIALPVQRRKRSAVTALWAVAALLFGALVFRVGWNNPNRRLIADLPVIQHVDIYSQFRDVAFLQQLQSRLSDNPHLSTADGEQIQEKLAEFQHVSSPTDRQNWLEHLSEDAKVTLRAKYNRFRDLSPDRQAQLRQLHQQIQSDDNSEQLLRTLFHYQQWLSRLPPSQQFHLRDELSASERATQAARQMQQPPLDQRFELTPEQLRELLKTVKPMFEEIFREQLASKPPRGQRRAQAMSERERLRVLFLVLRESPERMEALNEALLEILPSHVRQEFEKLSRREKGPIVARWLKQSHVASINNSRSGKRLRSADFPELELADYFVEELSPEQKEQLLALPRDQMQQRLRRLYRGDHDSGYDDPGSRPPRGFGPPRSHDRRPPHDRRDEFRGPPPRRRVTSR